MMKRKTWLKPKNVPVSSELSAFLNAHPLVGQALARRGITTVSQARGFLQPDDYDPAPAAELPDLISARKRLLKALDLNQKIAVWGDFDVDGQTSTALLVSALRGLELDVSYYIPLRDTESHGINIPGLKRLLHPGIDLLITCDTGIDEHEAVEYARKQGTDVIITDHHELPDQLPRAAAVINPNRLQPDHPLFTLPGAGVAYKLIEDLFQSLGKDAAGLLDLAALAVVSDVAVQTGDTRYLLQKGLTVLQTSPRPGLQALCDVIDLDPALITENEIGFQIGPRLNAAGRLGDANPAVEFLTARTAAEAEPFALHLEVLNRRRRSLTEQIYQEALEKISQHPEFLEDYRTLVLSSPDWHPGVIGIVASRLVERFRKPAILFVEENGRMRGSARSVEGVSIIDFINLQADLLTSFGGHPMAAGMELPADNLPAFRRNLSLSIQAHGIDPEEASALQIDGFLPFSDINLELIDDLSRLAPFGPGNPPLTLATNNVTLIESAEIGKDRSHRKLSVRDPQGSTLDVLWWNSGDLPEPPDHFDLAYQVSENYYRGQRRLQVTLQDLKETREAPAVIPARPARPASTDFRNHPDPDTKLKILQEKHSDLQIWREDRPGSSLPGANRLGISQSSALVIWTRPASGYILSSLIKRADPDQIYYFSGPPPFDTLNSFRRGLIGMVKYDLLRENYELELSRLAAAASQTESVILKGLEWLDALGQIQILSRSKSVISIEPGGGSQKPELSLVSTALTRAFAETQFFRLFYQNASLENIL